MDIAKFLIGKKESSVDAAKKQHEQYLNDSTGLDQDDFFAQDLNSPNVFSYYLTVFKI